MCSKTALYSFGKVENNKRSCLNSYINIGDLNQTFHKSVNKSINSKVVLSSKIAHCNLSTWHLFYNLFVYFYPQ